MLQNFKLKYEEDSHVAVFFGNDVNVRIIYQIMSCLLKLQLRT